MAEVKEEEQQKKGGILKIILFVIGGILLIILGLGIGYFIFGGEPEQDPSQEVNQIIEGEPKAKDVQDKDKNAELFTKPFKSLMYTILKPLDDKTDNIDIIPTLDIE